MKQTSQHKRNNNMSQTEQAYNTRQEILTEMATQFPVRNGGGIDYRKAFESHPEWRTALNWDDKKSRARTYAAGYIVSRRLKAQRRSAPLNGQSPEAARRPGPMKGTPGKPWSAARRARTEAKMRGQFEAPASEGLQRRCCPYCSRGWIELPAPQGQDMAIFQVAHNIMERHSG